MSPNSHAAMLAKHYLALLHGPKVELKVTDVR